METLTLKRDLDLTEIINGEEVVGPSPFSKHQRIAVRLFTMMYRHIEQENIGFIYFSPLDVIFEEGINRVQPDILFIRKDNAAIIQDWIRGVPDMVCEIISPGSYDMDVSVKKAIYEKYGVPEYWVVLPDFRAIEVLIIDNDKYVRHSYAELEGVVTSKAIEGLQVNIKDVFEE
ncbi:Uma2 family endonuclease [Candidatus Magnetominusculus dajiuhuensis]|uniref:Uma2 family endonuclease n=1 Tax=Candidatus Magnetominusculus dajiuhuensis TaxID=3137712 RepID=UPI003B436065